MELRSTIYTDILSPLAAFVDEEGCAPETSDSGCDPGDDDWCTSPINPQSRIDSLTPRIRPTWRLDGVDIDGRRFYAVPIFAIDTPPLRIDVYIPPQEDHPRRLRELLKSEAAIYTSSNRAVGNLPISKYLLRALDHWSSRVPDFRHRYMGMPFGSQILITVMAPNLDEMEIHLVQRYEVEQAMLSIDALRDMWNIDDVAWPEAIDWTELRFRRQLHEAITVVQIPKKCEMKDLVFKSLIRNQKYMYNELKMFLRLQPHPNIIARPQYLVTKKCRFGGKRGVCGFILEYFAAGSLKENLSSASHITLEDCFRWSRQVTEALIHINSQPFGFYPDLKPDNIVLQEVFTRNGTRLDAVLLDLEQRGGWFSWSPPEVAYVEYMEILALRLEDKGLALRNEIIRQLDKYIPGWSPPTQDDRYRNVEGGFSSPWLALLQRCQDGRLPKILEKAQVFMLGKLLWCIFERRPLVRCGIDHELLQDNDPDFEAEPAFPEFRKTPLELRALIRACTRGGPEWEGRRREVVLRGGRLVPGPGLDRPEGSGHSRARETRKVAKNWWTREMECAKVFMRELLDRNFGEEQHSPRSVLNQVLMRPLLADVLSELVRIEKYCIPSMNLTNS